MLTAPLTPACSAPRATLSQAAWMVPWSQQELLLADLVVRLCLADGGRSAMELLEHCRDCQLLLRGVLLHVGLEERWLGHVPRSLCHPWRGRYRLGVRRKAAERPARLIAGSPAVIPRPLPRCRCHRRCPRNHPLGPHQTMTITAPHLGEDLFTPPLDTSRIEKADSASSLVRSCVSEFSGFLVLKQLACQLQRSNQLELSPVFNLRARDEDRHGDRFNGHLRCWPGLHKGLHSHLLNAIFLWSMVLTHGLTAWEWANFYKLLGMVQSRFDKEVMCNTNRTAHRAFRVVFSLEGRAYFELPERLLEVFCAINATANKSEGPVQLLEKIALKARFADLLLGRLNQPMVPSSGAIA